MCTEPKYWLLSLVKVDRGMIPTGANRRDGSQILGQHIPYYAGLVIQHKESGKRYFLDEFNSEVLLREYLGKTIVYLNELVEYNKIGLVTVKDLDNFIKTNGLIKKHRNADTMRKIAKQIKPLMFE